MSAHLVTDCIDRPEIDNRTYRVIRLENNLEALLVHDPDTDKASAALDVHVGHLSDPWDAAGLAHFCEHLLFMGTEKYPEENAYSQFLSSHNGSSNAYTGTVDTNYFFDVGHEYLDQALDRFSQFFICPLFLESCKDRELLAVESENKKNLQNDMWRAYQLEKSLSNPDHVYSKFGTGNLETLKTVPESLGNDVREELLKFHKELYSANQMKLVLLGRDSLDTLEKMTIDKFSAIKNKHLEAPTFPGEILRSGHELGTIYTFRPVKEVRNLELCFPIPDCNFLWRSQPSHYISHLIGHEGEGSILSYLKKQGWVLYLGAGGSDASPGTDFFKINMELTLDGAQNWQSVVEIVFTYINNLKKQGIQAWIFDELKLISEAQFRFKEKQPASRFTSSTAGKMHSAIDKQFILDTTTPREFREDEIQTVLDAINHKNFRVALASPEICGELKKEKYYGTEYRIDKLSEELLYNCSPESPISLPELHLPMKNDFIPQNFDTKQKDIEKKASRPTLIKHTPHTRVWHKKDDTFWVPKANYLFLIRNPAYVKSAETAVMVKLFLELLKDDLNEYAYNADIAGLQYAIEASVGAFTLNFGGYNDKMSVLVEKVVHKMKTLVITTERFEIEKDRLARDLNNFDFENPYTQVGHYMSYIQAEVAWTKQQQLSALNNVDCNMIRDFASKMFEQFHVEVLAHGNLSRDEVLTTTQTVENLLSTTVVGALGKKPVILLKTKSVPNDPYEKAFLERGYAPYFVPVLDHAMVNLDKLLDCCAKATVAYSGLIVTSQRSVEALGSVLSKLDLVTQSALFKMPVYTVGPATRAAIEALGFTNVQGSESGNGDALATFILSERASTEQRPLFFAVGDKRRDIISKRMSASQIPLEELVVYETITASTFESDFEDVTKRAGAVEWLVFFSPAGADVALRYIQRSGNKTKVATIGPTTEDYLVREWSLAPAVVSPKPEAASLVQALLGTSSLPQPLTEQEASAMRALWMPVGSHSCSNRLRDISNTNSCIEYFVQIGPSVDVKEMALCRLFAQVCSEPAFNQLRTKEQLGYIVFSGSKVTLTSNGFRILIQSEKTSKFLSSRVDAFLDLLREMLRELSPQDFEKHRISLIDKLNEKLKNLSQETKRYWSHITSGLYQFDEIPQQTSLLRSFDKAALIEFFDTFIHYDAPKRRHILMSMDAQHEGADAHAIPLSPSTEIRDLQAFKAQCAIMDWPVSQLPEYHDQANAAKL